MSKSLKKTNNIRLLKQCDNIMSRQICYCPLAFYLSKSINVFILNWETPYEIRYHLVSNKIFDVKFFANRSLKIELFIYEIY